MKNWTIKQRILTHSAILCAVIAGLSLFALKGIESLKEIGLSLSDDSIPGTIAAQTIRLGRTKTQILLQQMLLARTPAEIDALKARNAGFAQEVTEAMNRYEPTIFSAEDRADFDAVKQARTAYFAPKQQFLDTVAADREAAADIYANQIVPLSTIYDAACEKLLKFNVDQAARRGLRLKAVVQALAWSILSIGSVAVATGIAVSLVNIRKINRALVAVSDTLHEGAAQVAAAAAQVSGASQSLAEGASEQAASLEETSASVEEIGSMTQRNAANAGQARTLSAETRSAAEEGVDRTSEMGQAMDAIREAAGEMTRTIGGIQASSQEVAKIVKVIDEIAFQTNILALNAAVEAARAGQAGAGFAAVADEVRNLAHRSSQAAKETARLIEQACRESTQGVAATSKVEGRIVEVARTSQAVALSLKNILAKAGETDSLIAEIAVASQEQSDGLSQIGTAMTGIDHVTQSNAAAAEESASAAEELNAQSAELQGAVHTLVRLVTGGQTATALPALPRPVPVAILPLPAQPFRSAARPPARGTRTAARFVNI